MAVTLDAANTVAFAGEASGSPTSHTFDLTIPSGTGRKVCIALYSEGGYTFSLVKYNGSAATVIGTMNDGTYELDFYYYDVPDALGAGTYAVTYTSSTGTNGTEAFAWCLVAAKTGAVEAYQKVYQDNSSATVTIPNLTVTAGSYTLSVEFNSAASPTSTQVGTTERWDQTNTRADCRMAGGDAAQAGAGTVSVVYTNSSTSTNKSAMAISVAAAAATGATLLQGLARGMNGGMSALTGGMA